MGVEVEMNLLFCIANQIIDGLDRDVHHRPTVSLPLGPLLMAGYLQARNWLGHQDIYDARLSANTFEIPGRGRFFGDTPEEMARRLRASQADVIAISNMFSWQIDGALELAAIAKQVLPNAITVIGGPHASSFPDEMLAHPAIDYVVMGEGEERLYALLTALEAGERVQIQGVMSCPEDRKLLRNSRTKPIDFIEPLDTLPLPAYDMVDVERYFQLQANGFSSRPWEGGKRVVSLLTSRGCPHQCIFCSIQATMGYRWRHHSPDYIKAHIDYLLEYYNIDYIHFEDDNFTHNTERYDNILAMLLDYPKPIPWDTPNGVRGDSWSFERVAATQRSGCQYLVVAVESAVQRVVDEVVKKHLNLEQVDELMAYCHQLKLKLFAFYVIGLPGETAEEIRATVTYALDRYDDYNVYPSIGMAVALPGTELHDIVTKNNLYTGSKLHYKPNEIVTDKFNPAMLQEIYDAAISRKTRIFLKKMLTSPREIWFTLRFVGGLQGVRYFLKRILLPVSRFLKRGR